MANRISEDQGCCSREQHLSCSFSTDSLGSVSPCSSETDDFLEATPMDLSSFEIHTQNCDTWSQIDSDDGDRVSSNESEQCHIEFDALVFNYPPLEELDEVRLTQYDFHVNGVECELDDIDIYLISTRQKLTLDQVVPVCDVRSAINPSFRQPPRASPHTAGGYVNSRKKSNPMCVFCKNNGEPLSVYGGHVLKDERGRTTCPVLRRYTCPKCGVSGDSSHTIKYCPLITVWEKMRHIQDAASVTVCDGNILTN